MTSKILKRQRNELIELQKQTKNEIGNLTFEIQQSIENESEFLIWECFENETEFKKHLAFRTFKRFSEIKFD